jgi:hypothetical protein
MIGEKRRIVERRVEGEERRGADQT